MSNYWPIDFDGPAIIPAAAAEADLLELGDREFDPHVPFTRETVASARRRADPEPDEHVRKMWREEDAYAIHGGNRPKLVFSNFLITISTNVVPADSQQRIATALWLRIQANELFGNWDLLNGTVLKPAGSPNDAQEGFGNNHSVEGCRSRVALESGGQKGQMHIHVVLEVAHRYADRNQWGARGVHVNCATLRAYLNARIPDMQIANRPDKIYVHSRLLTRLGQTQQKFMTLQYLEKEVDSRGQDLALDRERATPLEREIGARAGRIITADTGARWQDNDFGVGGGLDEDDPARAGIARETVDYSGFDQPPREIVDYSGFDRPPREVVDYSGFDAPPREVVDYSGFDAPPRRAPQRMSSPDTSSFDDRPLRRRQGIGATPASIAQWKESEAGKRAMRRARAAKK